ncbi:MAG: response regulator [Mariprofundaceae bacterium]|nr:response regulator [Mariprofundaceae bacterium]
MGKILIIDDEVQFRKMVRQMLERAGHTVVEAADGRQGEYLYRQQPADLIITDIFMPEQEGIETIIAMKRKYPDVKIIAVSGGGRNDGLRFLNQAEHLGADRIFEKPFERQELLHAITEILNP